VSSVVQLIILRARRSVMIVRAYQPAEENDKELKYRRILLPLDGSPRAEAAIPVAEALASHHEGEILIAHVVRQPEMPRRTPPTQEDIQLANQVTERNRDEASRYLMEMKTRLGGEIETRLLISDRVSADLHELVDQENIDLVVLSAHGYSGDTRWPYGSVVVSFIVYGTAPLLVVQDLPEDRIEPTPAEVAAATLDVKGFVRR
jgi:nucleotide-binding universal stress UspA family protein